MSSRTRMIAAAVGVATLAFACSKVPYTERKQFNLIPKGTMNAMGKSSYKDELSKATVVGRGEDVDRLHRVGRRIADRADEPEYAWETNLLKSDDINAWCLPGGYIGFYSGILPVLQSEAGMAFVMGHEVGHAIANHGAERMSEQLGISGALSLVDLALKGSGKLSKGQHETVMAALGLGAQYGIALPFSRAQEKEADIIGLMLMSEAGYPPKESIAIWDRMEKATGKGPPAFLSTHPANAARQDNLREWMPKARKKYDRNKRGGEDPLNAVW